MSISRKLLLSIAASAIIMFATSSAVLAAVEKTGVVTGEVVNFRQEPSLSSKILLQLKKGTKVTVIDTEGDWYKVVYSDATGWMHDDYVLVRDESIAAGVVTGSVVNVRSKPDIESEVLTQFEKGDKVEIFEHSGDWYRVSLGDDRYGWLHSDYVAVREEKVSRGSTSQTRQDAAEADEANAGQTQSVESASGDGSGSDADEAESEAESGKSADEQGNDAELRQQIVEYAKTLIGIKYVYGGESKKGFDCSGFVKYVYNHFGISITRVSADQSKGGKAVKKADLQPGDLVFFDTVEDGKLNDISHVGIYIGDGKFIHASTYLKKAITIESMSSSYYSKRYMKARDYISK